VDSAHVGRAVPDSRVQGADISHLSAIVASLLLFAFALLQGLGTKNARDFFIYRLGAELAVRGENPYDLKKIQQHVAAAYPEEDEDTQRFVVNSGYFLPPLAIVLFLPLAAMPAIAAKVCWALTIGIAGFYIARLPVMLRSSDSPPLAILPSFVIPFLLVLNPLTLAVVLVGQVSLLSAGCVAAGLWCIDRGRPYLASILWALPFMKPHLALPLIPLLWFLSGWRPAVLLVALVVILNLGGAMVVDGSPRFLGDYLESLSEAHKRVGFNRAESNPRITSWNRLLLTAGGPLIELNVLTTMAGYLVWFGLAIGRVALSGTWPKAVWAVAVAAVGAVLCSQVLVYELLILALVIPWVRDLFASGYRYRGLLAFGLLAVQLIPWMAMEKLGIAFPPSLGVVVLAVLVLVGPSGEGRDRHGSPRSGDLPEVLVAALQARQSSE
jgi:hypothetical protein